MSKDSDKSSDPAVTKVDSGYVIEPHRESLRNI